MYKEIIFQKHRLPDILLVVPQEALLVIPTGLISVNELFYETVIIVMMTQELSINEPLCKFNSPSPKKILMNPHSSLKRTIVIHCHYCPLLSIHTQCPMPSWLCGSVKSKINIFKKLGLSLL